MKRLSRTRISPKQNYWARMRSTWPNNFLGNVAQRLRARYQGLFGGRR